MGAEGPDRGTVPTDVTGRRGHSVREGRTTKLSRGEGGEGLRPGGSGVPVLTFCGAAGACPSCRPPRTAWAAACGPAGPALPGRREQPGAGVSGSGGGRAAPPPRSRPAARHGTVRYGTFARVHRPAPHAPGRPRRSPALPAPPPPASRDRAPGTGRQQRHPRQLRRRGPAGGAPAGKAGAGRRQVAARARRERT